MINVFIIVNGCNEEISNATTLAIYAKVRAYLSSILQGGKNDRKKFLFVTNSFKNVGWKY